MCKFPHLRYTVYCVCSRLNTDYINQLFILTHAEIPMVCLAKQTAEAATVEGRYLRNGSESSNASSHKYCWSKKKLSIYFC